MDSKEYTIYDIDHLNRRSTVLIMREIYLSLTDYRPSWTNEDSINLSPYNQIKIKSKNSVKAIFLDFA